MTALYPSPSHLSAEWRLDRANPMLDLESAIAAAKAAHERPLVLFVGGSPAWGDAVPNARDAVPARFAAFAEGRGRSLDVLNLACNGQLASDSYFIGRAGAAEADLVIIQVTYDNFSAEGRGGCAQRFPEIPTLLGERVTTNHSLLLGCDPTPSIDVTGTVHRWLRGRWALYRHRDRLTTGLFGGPPERQVYERWQRTVGSYIEELPDSTPVGSFVDLDPDTQTMMVDEWATQATYTFNGKDSEAAMLHDLCMYLVGRDKRVLVYLAPVNVDGVRDLGMFDSARFRTNVSALTRLVTSTGADFADLNQPRPLPAACFADINHTTRQGCNETARRLYDAASRAGVLP